MKRLPIYTVLVVLSATSVHAQTRNRIYQWNNTYNIENDPTNPNDSYLEVVQAAKTVTIVAGISGEAFEFEARKEELQGEEWVDIGFGDINLIQADENAGTVGLTVVGHNGHSSGALHVKEMNLGADGVDSTVEEFNIRGELGEDGETCLDEVSGPFLFDTLATDMHVDTFAQGASFRAIYTNADLYVTGAGPHQGDIDLGYFDYPEVVEITGTMEGSITAGAT